MEKYFKKLVEQFMSATGTKNVDVNSQQFIQEFSEWVKSRKIIGREYTSFIDYMGVHPTLFSEETVEIGKGKHDTIALETGIHMITPYSEGIERTTAGLITADFSVYDGIPVMVTHDKGGNQFKEVDTQYVRRFITQNPYEQGCIKNWEQLHNAGENITVGIFGSIYDKDIEQKIQQIEALRNGIDRGDFREESDTQGDNYYYAISSTRKVKILTKTLTR